MLFRQLKLVHSRWLIKYNIAWEGLSKLPSSDTLLTWRSQKERMGLLSRISSVS
jgi:hypothetical protein